MNGSLSTFNSPTESILIIRERVEGWGLEKAFKIDELVRSVRELRHVGKWNQILLYEKDLHGNIANVVRTKSNLIWFQIDAPVELFRHDPCLTWLELFQS